MGYETRKLSNWASLTREQTRAIQSELTKLDLIKLYNKRSFLIYQTQVYGESEERAIEWHELWDEIRLKTKGLAQELTKKLDFYIEHDTLSKVADKLLKTNRARAKRLAKKIENINLNNKGYFITLTFKDEVLSRTNKETRRKYVARTLRAISNNFVANIDFGDENQREHYHAVIESNGKPMLNDWQDTMGYVDIAKIGKKKSDITKLAKYTSKLTYHALKASTNYERLIYSKKEPFTL